MFVGEQDCLRSGSPDWMRGLLQPRRTQTQVFGADLGVFFVFLRSSARR